MGESADGDVIRSGFGVVAHILEIDSAGDFDGYVAGVTADTVHASAHLIGSHVVEEERFCSEFKRLVEFLGSSHLDFDGLITGAVRERFRQDSGNSSAEIDVIVLDEDSVGEVEAVVLASAAADGILVQKTHTGHGLAGIENACFGTRYSVHEAAGLGGDAAHPLEQVEDDPFAREDSSRLMAHDGDRLTLVEPHTVEDFRMADDVGVSDDVGIHDFVDLDDAGNGAESGENARLFGEDGCGCAKMRIDGGDRSGIEVGAIFSEGVFEEDGDATAVPIHVVSGAQGARRFHGKQLSGYVRLIQAEKIRAHLH